MLLLLSLLSWTGHIWLVGCGTIAERWEWGGCGERSSEAGRDAAFELDGVGVSLFADAGA